MAKKKRKIAILDGIKKTKKNGKVHPIFKQKLTLGQKASDIIASFGGSWTFISIFGFFLFTWMAINTWIFFNRGFDPYPYILLNLVLSCLAAIQAPIILMTQNRQAERDRIDAKYDHQINRKAEREIQRIQKDLYNLRRSVEIKKNNVKKKQVIFIKKT
jgi:uncharacterized membrane protein